MKKIILSILMALPLLTIAKSEDPKYLLGAVPEENGVVIFRKNFTVKDRTEQEIKNICLEYMNSLLAQGLEGSRNHVVSDGSQDGVVAAKVDEYMTFTKVFLNLDRTRFRYLITAAVQESSVKIQLTQISYYYNEDQNGLNGINYKAEEWITDKESVNKAGTKLYPKSGKFRRKTVDRVEQIFEGFMDAFEPKKADEPTKKVRFGIVEE